MIMGKRRKRDYVNEREYDSKHIMDIFDNIFNKHFVCVCQADSLGSSLWLHFAFG